MHHEHKLKIFTCKASKDFAVKVAKALNVEVGDSDVLTFSDGEFQPCYNESVRGATVFIVQSTFPPVDNLFELLLMIDAAKRASAHKVIAVMPYFGWARQDRKDKPRVSIGAKLVADLLSVAGVSRIITMDLHADQIQGFFDIPVDHLYASMVFIPYINSLKLDNLVIATPDVGGSKRASTYSKFLGVPLVLCHKTRAKANVVDTMQIIGDVKGKNVILVDDIVDTAGTISKAANLMMENGGLSVRAIASHCIMSGNASERVRESSMTEIVFTNSIPYDKGCPKVKQLSIAKGFAEAIQCVLNNKSISKQYVC